jgi:type IV secretory pathway VirB3-like protein
MHSTYLFSLITGPKWRLGVVQNALPLVFIGAGVIYMLMMSFWAVFVIAFIHCVAIWLSHRDPYFMNVWKARFSIKKTCRVHPSGGNIYAA